MHIIGTAGHVDHGKSSLVLALTGTNPDRWLEEQERGMTLDLGFARLAFDDGIEAGIIDVPGHARFLHNMLAGASGMEILVLVIAANEGVMPQTVEHMQILRYLNVRKVLVALTKIDLIEPHLQGEACRMVHEELRGTIAEDAGIFAVSTVTGANLDVLKMALHQELATLESRDVDAPAYFPVDRVFSLPGRGTIVTGTLMQGRIATGDALTLEPGGRPVRARTLQVFGQGRDQVVGGTRVAINVPGFETSDIARGHVIADSQFSARDTFNVSFSALDEAAPLLRRRNPVRTYIGSAEVLGTLVLPVVPIAGEAVRGELFLKEPVLAFPGVRFVVRRVSPKTLLGGGEIIGTEFSERPPDMRDAAAQIVLQILRQRAEALEVSELAFAANLREDAALRAAMSLVESGDAVKLARPEAFLNAESAQARLDAILSALETAHEREPWAMGLTSLALSRLLQIQEKELIRFLAAFVDEGRIAQRSGYFATTAHVPKLTSEQRAFFDREVSIDPAQPFVPADFEAVSTALKSAAIDGLGRAFDTLLARGVLVRVGEALYRGSQIEQIHQKMREYIEEHDRMTMAEFRDLLGTSRKYAVPLLEWFDSRGITVRSGDYRMLRSKKAHSVQS